MIRRRQANAGHRSRRKAESVLTWKRIMGTPSSRAFIWLGQLSSRKCCECRSRQFDYTPAGTKTGEEGSYGILDAAADEHIPPCFPQGSFS